MRPCRVLLLSTAVAVVAAVGPTGTAYAVTSAAAAPPPIPTLVGVTATHRTGVDRVVFRFSGALPASVTVGYVSRLIADGSGRTVPVAGRAILRVRLTPTNAHDAAGHPTAPAQVAFALPNAMTAVRAGDFEAVTTYGIGLASRQPFTVTRLQSPSRIAVDVRAAFPTVSKRVYLFDKARFVAGTEPFFVPVQRPVLPGTPGIGLLDRLFAGPTPAEATRGLQLLRSGATGWADLAISGQIARLRLTGGCSSGGSTATIAGEIMPTLRALGTVSFVKIYDPAGHTETPLGASDSIPVCLEP
jgi:hypothetical protein